MLLRITCVIIIFADYPSIVKGSGQSTASTVDIGTDACTSGDSVQIRCNLAGNLNLPRRWSRNGTALAETGSTLTVPRGTTGVYRCEVSNDCDTDSATTTVRSKKDLFGVTNYFIICPFCIFRRNLYIYWPH